MTREDIIQALTTAEHNQILIEIANGEDPDSFDLAGAVEYWERLPMDLLEMEYDIICGNRDGDYSI